MLSKQQATDLLTQKLEVLHDDAKSLKEVLLSYFSGVYHLSYNLAGHGQTK